MLIRLYDPNSEAEQLKTLSELTRMLAKLQLTQNSHIVFFGNFNLVLTLNLKFVVEFQFLENNLLRK